MPEHGDASKQARDAPCRRLLCGTARKGCRRLRSRMMNQSINQLPSCAGTCIWGIHRLQHRVQSDDGAQIWGRLPLSPQCSVPRQLGQLISQRRTLLRTILNCAPSGGLARTCSTAMPITCFNYPISMPIGMSVLANIDWRRRKNHGGWGRTQGPLLHAAVPLKALQPGRSCSSRRYLHRWAATTTADMLGAVLRML